MYWIMLSERSDEYEFSIDGTPPLIEENNWRFDCGTGVPSSIPIIDVPCTIEPDAIMVDNIPAYGCRGLLINKNVKSVFEAMSVVNMQYFDARLVDEAIQKVIEPYWIANIIGKVSCVDHVESRLEYYADGQIQFIDKLVLKPMIDRQHGHIFRLAEFLPVIVISDSLKNALFSSGVTGFTYYKPEEFSI